MLLSKSTLDILGQPATKIPMQPNYDFVCSKKEIESDENRRIELTEEEQKNADLAWEKAKRDLERKHEQHIHQIITRLEAVGDRLSSLELCISNYGLDVKKLIKIDELKQEFYRFSEKLDEIF